MPPLKYLKIKSHLEKVAVRPEAATRMPTVRELMKQFNVSLATVNRALSELENEGVIIRRQGAGIVATGTSRTVRRLDGASQKDGRRLVFAYNDYPDEMTWRAVHTISLYARTNQCSMVDCKLYPDTDTESLIHFIKAQPNCEGVILRVGADLIDAERMQELGRLPMPVVLLDSMYFYSNLLPDNVSVLSPDAVDCAEKTVEVLLRRGHRRIGFIRNEPRNDYTDLYQKALVAALRREGVEFGPEQIFSSTIRSWENSLDAAVQMTRNNLDEIRRLKLTALIYKSSNGALVAQKLLKEANLRVPEDISITGEGERSLYRYLSPGLTVVTIDYDKFSCMAVDIVLGKWKPETRNVLCPQELIERESVYDLSVTHKKNLSP